MDQELIYNILLVKYMEQQNIDEEFLVFPMGLFNSSINDKMEILVEAINKNVKVSNTDKYNECLEKIEL